MPYKVLFMRQFLVFILTRRNTMNQFNHKIFRKLDENLRNLSKKLKKLLGHMTYKELYLWHNDKIIIRGTHATNQCSHEVLEKEMASFRSRFGLNGNIWDFSSPSLSIYRRGGESQRNLADSRAQSCLHGQAASQFGRSIPESISRHRPTFERHGKRSIEDVSGERKSECLT